MTIFKKNGQYGFRIDVGRNPITGKRQQKYKTGFKTQREAQNALTELRSSLLNETYLSNNDITFEQFANQWLEKYKLTHKINSVAVANTNKNHLCKYIGGLKIQNITKLNYEKIIHEFAKKHEYSSTQLFHTYSKLMFKSAKESGIIQKTPTENVKIPKRKTTLNDLVKATELPKFMEKQEVRLFLDTAKNTLLFDDYIVFEMLIKSGMRVGELTGLLHDAVDLKENEIKIIRNLTYSKIGESYILDTPKTKSSIRTLNFDVDFLKLLEEHLRLQKIEKMKNRITWNKNHDFVFTDRRFEGFPKHASKIYLIMKKVLKKAGLPMHFTTHSLRHTTTSLLAAAGIELHEIMERLGHQNDQITRDIYLHITKDRKKEIPNKFAQFLRS